MNLFFQPRSGHSLPALTRQTFLWLSLACFGAAYAARPMQTDDARIVDEKACQLETWVRSGPQNHQFWALPGCNPTGNLEITVGGARTRNDGDPNQLSDRVFQAKTLFRTLQPNDWAWGLAVGLNPHPNLPRTERNDVYAYIPFTRSFNDDRTLLHLNAGALRIKSENRQVLTWGVGVEQQITRDTWLMGESFGRNEGRPYYQLGIRHWLIRDHVQLDMTYGNRLDNPAEERWFSIGLRLLSLPFLP